MPSVPTLGDKTRTGFTAPGDEVVAVFRRTASKSLGMLVGGIAMTACSVAVGLRYLPNVPAGGFAQFLGLIGIVFFGAGTVVVALQTLRPGPIIIVSRAGICDRRLSRDVIAWPDILGISVAAVRGQRFLMLRLRPEAERRLMTSPTKRLVSRTVSGWSGIGLSVTTLDVTFDELERVVREAHEAAGGGSAVS